MLSTYFKNKKDLAQKLGCHKTTIERWIMGKHMPDLGDLMQIKNVTGADLDYIATFIWAFGMEPDKAKTLNLDKCDIDYIVACYYKEFWRKELQ